MALGYRFNRLELAGSLGDLGTLLPLGIGMVMINGLSPIGLFFSVGLYYILSGIYCGVTVPIQPMKVIGAYAIATAMSASQILASGLLMAVVLLAIGATGAVTVMGKYTPKSVVRGVQLSTGTLLMAEGVKLMLGTSRFQSLQKAAEPYLTVQGMGPIPVGIIIGVAGGILTLLLLENKRLPAGLLLVFGGIGLGLILGTHQGLDKLKLGLNLPGILPLGFPRTADFTFALFALVLPQVPMTIGNAVIAYADLSREYFGDNARKVTYRSACLSMALANFLSFFLGGMPLCHGAGGLAAHYRFGARTAGSNIMIGLVFAGLAVLLGDHVLAVVNLLPMAVLGVLLLFAGSQLALSVIDIRERKDLFVVLVMLGITLASNLAVGFIVGIGVAYALKSEKLRV
ncbi:MAG: sulfate permease [Desulfobacteraceae bacterium]|nr:sulfate permease [Desulfobacteraceae bacterium]